MKTKEIATLLHTKPYKKDCDKAIQETCKLIKINKDV